jgi:hypothetical protein
MGRKGASAIHSANLPEANCNVKREVGIFGALLKKRIVTHGGVPFIFFPNCLKFPANNDRKELQRVSHQGEGRRICAS